MEHRLAISGITISERKAGIAATILGATLFICNLARTLWVPLTCDESPNRSDLLLSYSDFVHLKNVTANIHILNSILRKASIEAFGNTPFFLRLPNILAQLLFMVCCYRLLCLLFREGRWRFAVFALCNLNPFLFEFWGYSRGYGLAVAFMTGSIYCLMLFLNKRKPLQLWLSLISAMAAVWSNFALLNFFLALACVLAGDGLLAGTRHFVRKVLPALLICSGVLAWLIYNPIKKLRDGGELYYGGEEEIIHDTIRSLVKESLFISDPERLIVMGITYGVAGIILISSLFYLITLRKSNVSEEHRKGLALCLLMLIPLISIVAQHHLMGTKYLIDRTALFLTIPIVLHLCYWLYLQQPRWPMITQAALWGVVALFTLNFIRHINFHSSRSWWYDAHNLKVLRIIASRHADSDTKIRLRTTWMHMPSIDYYIYTRYDELFYPLEYIREAPGPSDTMYDYIYLPKEDTKGLSATYEVDTSFESIYFLYRKK